MLITGEMRVKGFLGNSCTFSIFFYKPRTAPEKNLLKREGNR
jgi:hypothetical protein